MRQTIAVLLLLLFPAPAPAGDAEPVVLLDFEGMEPADGWSVQGLTLVETTLESGTTPSAGRALGIRGGPKAGHLYRSIPVGDWRPYRALSFFAKVDAASPIEMRVAAVEAGSFRSLLHRLTLAPGGWREVVLPLAEFRPDFRRAHGRFDRVGRILLGWDAGEGSVVLDDFRLFPGERGEASCLPTVAERLALAFPDGKGRVVEGERFVLLTDVPALVQGEGGKLLARLEAGLDLLVTRYRVPGELSEKVPLCVFRTEADYRAFPARVGEHYGANVSAPKSDGFSLLGYATGFWDPKQGADRPVFVHEAMHAALERLLFVGSDGNWVQEGLASAVHAKLCPGSVDEAEVAGLFAARAEGKGSFRPLGVLLATGRPGMGTYLQLFTFFEYLAERRGDELPAFWEELGANFRLPHESGPPALEKALGAPLETIGAEWLEYGRERYRGK